MFHSNDYPRLGMFQGKRSQGCKESSQAMRAYGEPANHPRSIVAQYPNIELSQTSQLSMDSHLRSASQSSIPLGQPSASMSSSSREQLRPCHYQGNPSCDFGDRAGAYNTSFSQQSQSSFSAGSIKSALRGKSKEKMKKTRFAGDTQGLPFRNRTNQGSQPPSFSSSRSCGSHCTSQSGCRIQAHYPARTMHLGSSSYHSQRQNQFTEASYPSRRENRFDHGRAIVLKTSEQRARSPKKQKLSPSTPLLGQIFSKIPTPRKRLEIPYPPIKSQPQEGYASPFRRNKGGKISNSANDETPKSRNGTERGRSLKESAPELRNNDDVKSDSGRTSVIHGETKQCDEEPFFLQESSSLLSGPEGSTHLSTSNDGASEQIPRNTMESSSSIDNDPPHSEKTSEAVEPENFRAREDSMEDFKTRLRKILSDMESEAKVNFQKVSQTITSATESKLDEKAKALQEVMKVEMGEKANAIQEVTQSNIDLIRQKRSEAEKAIETLVVSTTTKVEATASVSVQNIQACTESGLSKLKKFTESWLANSCNSIANRLKPYLRLSNESNTTKHGTGDIVGGQATNVPRSKSKSHPVMESAGSNQLKRKSFTPLGDYPEEDQDEKVSSLAKGAISLTQGSKTVSRRKSPDKSPVTPLRRAKRSKQLKKSEDDTKIDGRPTEFVNMTTPTNDKKKREKSPPRSSLVKKKPAKETESILHLTVAKSDKALCVTPIEGNSQSIKKKTHPPLSSNKSKIEPKRLKRLRSKRRKRTKTQSPLNKKRPKLECDGSSRGSVPSEVFAFDDVQLSPLEDPNLFAFPKTTQRPKGNAYGSRPPSKPSVLLGKKRRSTKRRPYDRRRKAFDVTDDDIFRAFEFLA